MEAVDHLKAILQPASGWSSIDRTGRVALEANGNCETMTGAGVAADVAFRFLRSNSPAPFSVRLGREVAEAARTIRQNPMVFIESLLDRGPISSGKRRWTRTGVIVAVSFYALVLSGIYASSVIFHPAKTTVPAAHRLQITYVAAPVIPVTKTPPPLKGLASIKDQLTAPVRPAEQPRAELPEAKPTPRSPNQTLAKTEPTTTPTMATAPYSPEGETTSRPASDGAARGPIRNGVGTASEGGRASSAEVNYSDVFAVSKVTTRPQMLARPVPGYTEEARRAQVEGAVRLSVILNSNGTVSDIRVTAGLGYGLNEKAIEAAKALRFVPAQKDGHIVSVRLTLEFKFTLL